MIDCGDDGRFAVLLSLRFRDSVGYRIWREMWIVVARIVVVG